MGKEVSIKVEEAEEMRIQVEGQEKICDQCLVGNVEVAYEVSC